MDEENSNESKSNNIAINLEQNNPPLQNEDSIIDLKTLLQLQLQEYDDV